MNTDFASLCAQFTPSPWPRRGGPAIIGQCAIAAFGVLHVGAIAMPVAAILALGWGSFSARPNRRVARIDVDDGYVFLDGKTSFPASSVTHAWARRVTWSSALAEVFVVVRAANGTYRTVGVYALDVSEGERLVDALARASAHRRRALVVRPWSPRDGSFWLAAARSGALVAVGPVVVAALMGGRLAGLVPLAMFALATVIAAVKNGSRTHRAASRFEATSREALASSSVYRAPPPKSNAG